MARAKIPLVIFDPTNSTLASGASVTINIRGAGAATVYADETSGTVRAQPLTSDTSGRLDGWLPRGAYTASATIPGHSPTSYDFDIVPGSDLAADTAFIGAAQITGPKIASGTVTGSNIATATITQANLASSVLPPGLIFPYAGPLTVYTDAPSGFLGLFGDVVSQATYPNLYAVIGSTYNTGGEGAGNFRLPNFRNRFPLGAATSGAYGLAQVGGSLGHTHNITGHTHTISSDGSHSHTVNAHSHYSPWPFGENGGGGNWIGAIQTGSGQLGDMGYGVRSRGAVTRAVNLIGRLINSYSGAIDDNNAGPHYSPYSDLQSIYDVASSAETPGTNSQGSHSHTGNTGANSNVASGASDPAYLGVHYIIKT